LALQQDGLALPDRVEEKRRRVGHVRGDPLPPTLHLGGDGIDADRRLAVQFLDEHVLLRE
jgi:hypothetical protein